MAAWILRASQRFHGKLQSRKQSNEVPRVAAEDLDANTDADLSYVESKMDQKGLQNFEDGSGQGLSSDEIISDSGFSEAEIWAKGVESVLDQRGKLLIKKKRASIRCKCVRQTKKRLAEARLMKRRRSKKVGKTVQVLGKK